MEHDSCTYNVPRSHSRRKQVDSPHPLDLLAAIGVLGVSGGLADGRISAEEVRTLVQAIAQRFHVTPGFAKALVRRALRLVAHHRTRWLLDECCRLVNETYTESQRRAVRGLLEEVAMADCCMHVNELIFLELISKKLRLRGLDAAYHRMIN